MTARPNRRTYVGFPRGARPEVFRSAIEPTEQSHGHRYVAVTGPFRTVRAAAFAARTYPNPHCRSVAEAERLARELSCCRKGHPHCVECQPAPHPTPPRVG